MDSKIISFTDMLNNHTGTIYIFTETGTGNLLTKTTDIEELRKIVATETIAEHEPIIIDGIDYTVVGFEIELMAGKPALHTKAFGQVGENNSYGISASIYVKKK
jgi:hypothetical protein